jgi:hypothetical protein
MTVLSPSIASPVAGCRLPGQSPELDWSWMRHGRSDASLIGELVTGLAWITVQAEAAGGKLNDGSIDKREQVAVPHHVSR